MSDRNLRIRVLMEGADRLTRPMRDAASGSTRLAQTLKATRDQLKGLQRAQADVGEFRQLKQGMRESERAMQQARARATELGRALGATTNPTRAMRTEFDRARRDAERLTAQHRQHETRLTEVRSRLAAVGVSTRNLVGEERRLRSEIERTNDSLRSQDRRLQEVSDRERRFSAARSRFSQVQGSAAGLAAGGAAAIGTGMVIARPLEGAAQDAMEFESVMTDINQKVNQSREAGRLMGLDLRRAALAVNQLPSDLQKGVDTLTGFGLGAQQAVDMMTPIGRAATAYKAEIDDLGRATFASYDNLKVPIGQTGKALDVMAQAGKSGAFEVKDMAQYFPELTASMQSLGSKGIPAVADLAAALQITRKGAGDSAGAATNLQNLLSKINAGDTIKNFKKFGIDIPAAMKKAAKEGRSPIEEIVRLTQKATGGDQAKLSSLFGDMQVQQALRPLMSAFQEYQSIRAEALGADGTVNTDFADRMLDSAEKVKRLRIQAKDLSTTVGDQLLPMIASASDYMSSWAGRIADFAKRHPQLTRALAFATALFAGLFLIMGGGAIILAGLVAPFAVLSAAATALGIGMLPLIGIVAGIVLGIGLLAAAGYLIYENWGAITTWFSGIWTEIQGYFNGGIAGIAAMLVNFSPMGLLYAGFAALMNWLGVSMPSRLSQAGSDLMQGLINGITGRLSALKSTIVGAANSAVSWFKEVLGIHSPSRVFASLGGFVMEGLDEGLADGSAAPLRSVGDLSNRMTDAFSPSVAVPDLVGSAGFERGTAGPFSRGPTAPLDEDRGSRMARAFSPDGLVPRLKEMSGQVGRALAAGAAGTAMATAPAAAQPSIAATGAHTPVAITYNIKIEVTGGAQGQDIADEVRKAIEQIERERRGRGFGDD